MGGHRWTGVVDRTDQLFREAETRIPRRDRLIVREQTFQFVLAPAAKWQSSRSRWPSWTQPWKRSCSYFNEARRSMLGHRKEGPLLLSSPKIRLNDGLIFGLPSP